jgi:hypothetical protein
MRRLSMAIKSDVRSRLRKQLGKDVADAMLRKVDKMVKQGASPAKIEKVILADLAAHLRNVGLALGTAVHTVPISLK